MPDNNKIEKEQIFNYSLLFTIAKAAIAKTIGSRTNKTDRIIFNSLAKAVSKHTSAKQENE